MYRLIIWDNCWADEFYTYGFDIISESEYQRAMLVLLTCDEALKEKLEDNEFYFESNEFHKFSFKDIVGTFEKAESISEEERDTICQLFGDSRGLTFTDEVLDIIGIRNV